MSQRKLEQKVLNRKMRKTSFEHWQEGEQGEFADPSMCHLRLAEAGEVYFWVILTELA